MKPTLLLRSSVFNLFLWIWTFIYGIIVFPVCLVYPGFVRKGTMTKIWARTILKALELICGLSYQVSGSPLASEQTYVLACKHQSAWETIFFLAYLNNPAYILKKELTYLPIYGWYLKKLGMIPINRAGGGFVLLTALKSVKLVLAQGRTLIIFPEGTRVKPGEIRECNSGIIAIYQSVANNYPLIPISLDSGKYWGKNSWLKYPGIIKVNIGEPLNNGLTKDQALEQIKEGINVVT